MRVTNNQTAEIIMNDLYKNKQLLLDAQIRLSSQKKINKPSDDPIGMGKILDYRAILSSIEQYNRNIDHGKMQIEVTETVLDEIDTLLNEAEKWARDYGTGNSNDLRDTALMRIKNIYDSIMDLANTKVNDNYIFGGFVTDTVPFTRDANYTATYAGDDSDQTVLVGDNVEVKINATGTDIFNGGTDVFGALENLINALQASDPALAYAEAAHISSAIDQVQTVATESAVHYGRLESAENYLTRYKANIEDMLGNTEDANLERAIVELQLQQTAYEASLSTASKIIQRSLVDYLL